MSDKKEVKLPEEPRDTDFEDYVAAHLQSAGNFIEKSIIERSKTEILELDIICTEYEEDSSPVERLLEIKSGGWGFTEIFKLSGWGKYLKIEDLGLVVCKQKSDQDFYVKKADDIGIDLSYLCNDSNNYEQTNVLRGKLSDPIDVEYLRFSYLLERTLLKHLNHKKKSLTARESYKALEHYYHTLNSVIFFSKNILKKVDKLYDAFKENPNITKKVGNESAGNNFNDNHEKIPDQIFNKTFYDHEYTDLTYSCYVEHRARLAILKSAIDFCLYEQHGIDERISGEIKMLGFKFSLKTLLPDNFLINLGIIKDEPYYHKYPVFWQNFLWLFGGMILEDYKEQEYKILSLKSGIPVTEIDTALAVYQKLFPVNGGWFVGPSGNSNIKHMKMMPLPFMGIGANYRKAIYTEDDSFESLKLTGTYTLSNLISWNNLAVEVMCK